MSEQDVIQIGRGVLDAFNTNNWDGFRALSTTNVVYNEVATQRVINGPDEITEAMQGWKTAFPDVTGTVTTSFASGNTAILEVTWRGTHTGPLVSPAGTIPPSGKSQTTPSVWVFECEGGKVRESRLYFDLMTLLTQIGAM